MCGKFNFLVWIIETPLRHAKWEKKSHHCKNSVGEVVQGRALRNTTKCGILARSQQVVRRVVRERIRFTKNPTPSCEVGKKNPTVAKTRWEK